MTRPICFRCGRPVEPTDYEYAAASKLFVCDNDQCVSGLVNRDLEARRDQQLADDERG